jgi:hypothetical protein
MKILDLLKENENKNKISVSDLNSLQLRTLSRLKNKTVDLEDAEEKELDIIMDLIDLGFVDRDGNVTDAGKEAVKKPDTKTKVKVDTHSSKDEDNDNDDELETHDVGVSRGSRKSDY